MVSWSWSASPRAMRPDRKGYVTPKSRLRATMFRPGVRRATWRMKSANGSAAVVSERWSAAQYGTASAAAGSSSAEWPRGRTAGDGLPPNPQKHLHRMTGGGGAFVKGGGATPPPPRRRRWC